MARAVGILLCAGTSARMGFCKLTMPLCGQTAIERSMNALLLGGCDALVFAASDRTRDYLERLPVPVPHAICPGGGTRQESVKNALAAAESLLGAAPDDIAVIHDAARCLVSPEVVRASIESAKRFGSGVAATPATDTVFRVTDRGAEALDRTELLLMQTPQTFLFGRIRIAYERADTAATDDCTLYWRAGYEPRFTEGEPDNFKLTTRADWERAVLRLCGGAAGVGTGFDTHRLVEGRKLILGGVEIPFEKGLLGHSDADVLAHAVTDALLGAAALGDIGRHFPDTDERYRGIDSLILLAEAVRRVREAGFAPLHIDATVIAQRPRLAPYIGEMRARIAEAAGTEISRVSVKATTTEGMNDEGRGLCISAQAIALVQRTGTDQSLS